MADEYSPTIYTSPNGQWQVCVRMNDGRVAVVDSTRYPNEASATLSAIKMRRSKPFIDYAVVRT